MRGKVGGWTNAANLGGGALGAMLIMWLTRFMGFHAIGAMIGGLVIASTAVLGFFPPAVSPVLGARRILGGTMKSVVRTSMQRHVLLGFLLFLSPAGAVAAINLSGGLAPIFTRARSGSSGLPEQAPPSRAPPVPFSAAIWLTAWSE